MVSLPEHNIRYMHFVGLGGRRKVKNGANHTAWRNASFQAYADYMETEDFEESAGELQRMASAITTAYMCSEAVWWRCHRAMVSDYLKCKGWKVMHIMNASGAKEHPYTSPAVVENGRLSYRQKDSIE